MVHIYVIKYTSQIRCNPRQCLVANFSLMNIQKPADKKFTLKEKICLSILGGYYHASLLPAICVSVRLTGR
jgi:hypothetical protein